MKSVYIVFELYDYIGKQVDTVFDNKAMAYEYMNNQ